jgi:hypothetical protein
VVAVPLERRDGRDGLEAGESRKTAFLWGDVHVGRLPGSKWVCGRLMVGELQEEQFWGIPGDVLGHGYLGTHFCREENSPDPQPSLAESRSGSVPAPGCRIKALCELSELRLAPLGPSVKNSATGFRKPCVPSAAREPGSN